MLELKKKIVKTSKGINTTSSSKHKIILSFKKKGVTFEKISQELESIKYYQEHNEKALELMLVF